MEEIGRAERGGVGSGRFWEKWVALTPIDKNEGGRRAGSSSAGTLISRR
jgi:hypothetical protein